MKSAHLFRVLPCAALTLTAFTVFAQHPTGNEAEIYDDYMARTGGVGSGGRGGVQVTISPDGAKVGWVGASPTGTAPNTVWIMPIAGGNARPISAVGPLLGRQRDLAWSPDGESIVFLAGTGTQSDFYLAKSAGGPARKFASFRGQAGPPVWSPDGKAVAFLAIENPKRVSGATQPFKPETGVIGSKPDVQRVAIFDLPVGGFHWASPAGMYVYEFGWSPTSREIAVTAALPPGENNWWKAKLFAADADSGKLRLITTPDLQINSPRWSLDGKSIAYIGGLMSDFGSVGGDIYTVPAVGGTATNRTPGHKGSPNFIRWMRDGSIFFGEAVEGEVGFQKLDPRNGRLTPVMRQAASFSGPDGRGIALSTDERTEAYANATLTHGSEIFAGPVGKPVQITHWNDKSVACWGKIESIRWKNDKLDVQGWLVAPAKVEDGKKYPMIVQVHGGPASAVSGSWSLGQQAAFWSLAGYYVFMPNPRGSFGEGEEFTKGNRKDFGYGDLRDIMSGVDKVLKTEPVDPSRLGLTGGSYGGYMTMWGVTQTHRFKAAVAVAGIANWKSYYGENSIDEWMIPFFGATVYDDPKVYAKSSPIEFIKNVTTPTLIAVGEFDGECPPPQSYEYWHALNVLKVPTELLVYAGEGHGVRSPENRRDLMIRELAWFNFYLK